MWLKHLASDGQTYLDFSWGNPRGFESHSFHRHLLVFLKTTRKNNTWDIEGDREEENGSAIEYIVGKAR